MNKKIISAALAALMMCSTAAIAASADEVAVEPAGAAVTFETSGDAGKIKFDMGDSWDHGDKILLYMWAEKEGESMGCTAGEWGGEATWGTKKNKMTPVEGEDGVVESYEFELPDSSWNVFVIFHDSTTDAQTCNCILTENGMGKTARLTGETFENPVDSEKVALDVVFDGADDCGAHKLITSTGNIVGHAMAPNDDGAYIVAKYVYDYMGKTDKGGEECCTEAKVENAINEFGTTADDAWAKFQAFKGQEGREDYDTKEADAKKLIKPTEEKKDETTDSDKKKDDNSSNNSSNSSSKASSTSTTGTSTTKTTTTASATTSATASTEAAAATGDATNTAAFAVVFLAAAAAMFFARKKVEE